MARPQIKNGYTPISNELLDAICRYDLTKNELKVLLCIMRHTYGYSRKECSLSVRDIANYTGIALRRVSEPIQSLNVKKLLSIEKAGRNTPQKFSLNKDYETWERCDENRHSDEKSHSDGKRYKGVTEIDTPYLLIENNIKSNIYNKCDEKRHTSEKLPEWFEEVWKAYPSKKGKNRISKKCYTELINAGKETLLQAVRNYKAYCKKNTWYHPQNGSTFFNGGWKDYIDHDAEPEQTEYRDILELIEEEQNAQ